MLKASTPVQPPAGGSSSSRAAPPAGFALSSLSSHSSPAGSTASLDSPPISSFAKRYRATPLPTPMNESMPVTPLSSEGVSSPGTLDGEAAVDDQDDETEEVTLVRRNTGKGYRYQRKGEVIEGQKERRSSSSSSAEERKRVTAAEKVEQSRIKVRAARLAEQEERDRQQEEQQRKLQEEQERADEQNGDEGGGSGSRRGSSDPIISYAQQMQNHMLALMKGMEKIEVTPGFIKRNTDE